MSRDHTLPSLLIALSFVASCADFGDFEVRTDAGNNAEAGSADASSDRDVPDADAMSSEGGQGCAPGQCTSLQYCGPEGTCLPRVPNAQDCTDAAQCLSGYCDPDGVCCMQGEDCCNDDSGCAGEYRCDVGARKCFATCTELNELVACKDTGHCSDGNNCVADLAPGAAQQCDRHTMCAGNANCNDNYCCDGACGGCRACNLAGSLGVCANVPNNSDPHGSCALNGCLTDGMCNGNGGCRVVADNTDPAGACSPSGCIRNGDCNGMGQCRAVPAGQDPANFCVGGTNSCDTGVCNGAGICTPKADGATCGANSGCGAPRCSTGSCMAACEYSGAPACEYCAGDDDWVCGGCGGF